MLSTLFLLCAITTPGQQPLRGEALLDELSKRAVRFFWEQSHPTTGLTKDRAANLVDTDTFDVSSVASVGFALTAYAVGAERGWLGRDEALDRVRLTLRSLESTAQRERGWFYHFIDWETGRRVWDSEASSIDTSILLAGILVAETYFRDPQVDETARRIRDGIDWVWMLTDGGAKPDEATFSHGYIPEKGFLPHRWANYSEHPMLVLQGLGSQAKVPPAAWEAFRRNVIEYKGLELLEGGPLFMHQMSHGFLDFSGQRDRLGFDYAIATRNATLANRLYCIENPKGFKDYGPNFWGLTAGDSPDGYKAFGAPGWGEDNGTIVPTCAVASMPFTAQESLAAAEYFYENHPEMWGRYGFSNAINPSRDWVGPDVIGIDLGMMMMGIENYRDGFVWRMSMAHPVYREGMRRAGLRPSVGSSALRLLR
jgi:hypothetical protein